MRPKPLNLPQFTLFVWAIQYASMLYLKKEPDGQ